MSKLTIKQENFCLAYIETGDASEAYRRAYNAKRMKPETINRNAAKLLKDNKITTRIAEIREPVIQATQYRLQDHLTRLRDLSEKAEASNQFSAAITAEISRGKASGFYIEKLDHTSSDGSMSPTQHPTTILLIPGDEPDSKD